MSRLTRTELRKLRDRARRDLAAHPSAARLVVGLGTCGVAAGGLDTLKALQDALAARGVKDVAVRQTGCLGLCHVEPTVEVVVPGAPAVIYGRVDPARAAQIVEQHVLGKRLLDGPLVVPPEVLPAAGAAPDASGGAIDFYGKQVRVVLRNCGVIDPDRIEEYVARDGYAALDKALFDMRPDDVLAELEKSGLRGRGGAGFPTFRKWAFSRQVAAPRKFVVCNADEGDPGAYMDRATIEGDPHAVLEAMAIAGRTVGADHGIVYVRAEYPLAIARLETAIAQARALGLLGPDILGSGFAFDIELRLGAGAFVCGEETALIASVEGNRGMPRPRPPFPAARGLWDRPTVINNVETLAAIPTILRHGGEWYARLGTPTSRGTKVFALTGKVNRCGLIEVPMGTTLRTIVFDIGGGIRGGKAFKAAQTGGPSGGVIPAEFLDTPIDYEHLAKIGSIMGSGGLIVLDEDDCMVDVAKFYLSFTVDESCGKCAPCRVGGRTLFNLLDKVSAGQGRPEDLDRMRDVCLAMQRASLCGLGQSAPNPVLSTLRYFADEYEEHIRQRKCRAHKCKTLVSYAVDPARCVGCTACARACPADAVRGERKKAHTIDPARCIRCGKCYEACKFQAVRRT